MLRQTDACWSSNLVLITQIGFVMKQTYGVPQQVVGFLMTARDKLLNGNRKQTAVFVVGSVDWVD